MIFSFTLIGRLKILTDMLQQINLNNFLSALTLSAPPSAAKPESKEQETKENIEGMKRK